MTGLPAMTAMEARAVEVTGRYALDVITAKAALDALPRGSFDAPEWKAHSEACERWVKRPRGRSAPPGDLQALQRYPGDYPHQGDIACRRCGHAASLEGHPYGCPATPGEFGNRAAPLRSCYCGQTIIAAPAVFGVCCEGTPPVRVPGGCRSCGSGLCAVGDPDDFPVKDWYVTDRHPEMGNYWVHPRCIDSDELERAADGRHSDAVLIARVEDRRRRRRPPLGVVELWPSSR